MTHPYFVGLVYEGIIMSITLVLMLQVIKICIKNRNELNLLLLLLISNYFFAIFFSWLAKFLIIYSNIDYLSDDSIPDPLTPLSWILLRISYSRISLLLITIATCGSYIFKEKVFEKQFKKTQSYLIITSGILIGLYSLVVYEKGNLLLDVIATFLVFLLMCVVYIPFMKKSIRSYKNSSIRNYKNAFLSLAIMSLSFLLIFFCFLINHIYFILDILSTSLTSSERILASGYTFFYYLGWIFVIVGVTSAYLALFNIKEKEN